MRAVQQHYTIDDDGLSKLLHDMKSRVEAIEYEVERRRYESERTVLEFIGKRFKPRPREAYSQSF